MFKSVAREKWHVVNTMIINETCHNLTKVTGIRPHNPVKKTGLSSSNKKSTDTSLLGIPCSRHLFCSLQFKQNTNKHCRRYCKTLPYLEYQVTAKRMIASYMLRINCRKGNEQLKMKNNSTSLYSLIRILTYL